VQLLKLLLRDLNLFERGRDLVERQIAAFLAVGNEAAQLIEFVDWRPILEQNLVVDASTLPWVAPSASRSDSTLPVPQAACANVSDSTRLVIRQCLFEVRSIPSEDGSGP